METLLDTLEAMMIERDIDDIGYYDIVKRAGMPAASVYHFFPTKQTMLEALAGRYFRDFIAKTDAPVSPRAMVSWQEFISERLVEGVAYYNSHPAAMRLILGSQPFLEIREADTAANIKISAETHRIMDSIYQMPTIRDAPRKFLIALTLGDAVCRASYNECGIITPEFTEEARRALIAYYRTFLPEHLEPR